MVGQATSEDGCCVAVWHDGAAASSVARHLVYEARVTRCGADGKRVSQHGPPSLAAAISHNVVHGLTSRSEAAADGRARERLSAGRLSLCSISPRREHCQVDTQSVSGTASPHAALWSK